SMALMDAGIPVREHVAGVSVGLVTEVDPETGIIKDYRILTDILGLEDHLGDMDFKIAGTRKGVTAIQLDIKPAGIPLDIICECLEPALKGRLQILEHMERQINAPRTQDEKNSPRLATLKYNNESLRSLIGPQGVLMRKIEKETGVRMSVGDGTLTMLAKNQNIMDKALEMVDSIIGREIEVGGIYKGVVSSIKEYGAFVEFNGGQQGLLHISELSHDLVARVSDVISVGQQLSLMCIGQDVRGNIKLSLKQTLPQNKSKKSISEGSVTPIKQEPNVWASLPNIPNDQETYISSASEDENEEGPSSTSTPSFLIRSAAECDEEVASEKLAEINNTTKVSGTKRDSSLDRKSKKVPLLQNYEEESSVISKKLAQIKKNTKVSGSKKASTLGRKTKTTTSLGDDDISSLFSTVGLTSSETVVDSNLCKPTRDNGNDGFKGGCKTGISAKSLKLGDKLDATVYQIRAHGIVLDLGGGIRGMHRFEENGKTDFKVGEELRVKCSSFSTKGIPVVSLLEDE
ncbi:Polyribonucleotide nucleotidyltransferase, partial [Thalictrum thalictroides]